MIIGEVLQGISGTAKTYFGPWMPADGNLAVMSCEVIQTDGMDNFNVTVETKNSEQSDKDAASPAGGASNAITLSAETITKFNVGAKLSDTTNAGFKELFRYKFTSEASDAIGSGGTGFVHFRMLAPAWLTH